MVQYYSIFGAKVGSHYLAMGVLSMIFGGATLALGGGGSKTAVKAPPINAGSRDEEDFIKKFMEQADAESKQGKH